MGDLSGQTIKGYELIERIGAGGFGAVYRASQSTVGREVAVKLILPGLANQPEFVRRFETEAQIVARLEHLHIVPLYDYWRDPEGAYLVMRLLRGGSLRDALQRNGAYDLETAVQFFEQIASGLAVAHRHNVIHRDLKPGNILLDEDGNAYLADFGIAKDLASIEGNSSQSGNILGSPEYLAPEQARGESVTPQTDIYSLGVVLYEMLTGRHPFPNLAAVEVLFKHLNETLPRIETLPVDAQDAVNVVIQKATAKNPQHRYENVLALSAAFREAAALNAKASTGNVVEALTPREQEILQAMIEGQSNKQIAAQLFVTIATVKWYITQIYRKLGVRSRVQAIVRAREFNLIVSGFTADAHGGPIAATSIPTDLFKPDNPYKGLRPFESVDYRDFFGREKLVGRLVKRLGAADPFARFLAVVGPSGSGKSSLIKAGLIPALWRGDVSGSEKWFVVEMIPGARPLDELEVALTRLATNPVVDLHEQLERDQYGLLRAANLILPNDDSEVVLVIDQFEEAFTLIEDESVRVHFLRLLYATVTEPRSRVRVVIALRADFYDRPLHYADFGEMVRSRMETVLPLGAKELERAIITPSEHVGVSFEEGLVAEIIEEVLYQPAALPLLQYALTELFEARQGRLLTNVAYQHIGGAVGALARRAEELYQEFSLEGQQVVRQMFLRLVMPGDGTEDTRRRVSRGDLLALVPDAEMMDEVVDTFVDYRLLTLDHDPATRTPTVEVAHEAILREWERLRSWLEMSRDEIRMQRQLAYAFSEWEAGKEDDSFLLRGIRLTQFETWASTTDLALMQNERHFLQVSIANRIHEAAAEQERQSRESRLERRSQTFLRSLVGVLLVATVGAFVLTAVAINQRNIAERNAEVSQSLALASAARAASAEGNMEQALALAVAANQGEQPPVFSQSTLYETALSPGTQFILNGGDGWRWVAEPSPDRQLLAVQEDEVRIALWDLQTREVVMRLDGQHPDGLAGLAFTPDNQQLLVGSWDDALELWDLNTGEVIWQAVNPAGDPNTIAISPDGVQAIVASEQGVATLWDLQSGEYIGELAGHDPDLQLLGVAISPDGQMAATASEDGTVILWDITERELLHRLEGHDATVFSVSFSPDGKTLASSGFDNSVMLWNVETGEMQRQLNGHTDFIFDIAWSPDSTRLLSSSRDSTLILWDALTGTRLHSYRDEAGRSFTVSFIDDRHAVSGGSSSNVRFWSLYNEREQRRISLTDASVFSMAISADEQTAALGTRDAVVLINLQTGEEVQRFNYQGGNATSVALGPDRTSIIAGFEDGSVLQWNIESGDQDRNFEAHESTNVNENVSFSSILDIAISPDGQYLATSGEDKTMMVWDVGTGATIHRFENCSGTINTMAFSPDGQTVAGGFGALKDPMRGPCTDFDFTVHMWDVGTGDLIRQLSGHNDAVTTVQYCDDRHLVSGSFDETVRLWDVETGTEIRRFDGHTGAVSSVDCSVDGRYITSSALDGTISVWDAQTGALLRQVMPDNGQQIIHAEFVEEIDFLWSASANGNLQLWSPMLAVNDLLIWVTENRYVRELTCSERELYRVMPLCQA